ncbi:hypothetical protein ACWKW4_14835 [Hydrogenophaga borbori]
MHTDTQKKKPAGDGNPTAGHTDVESIPPTTDAGKACAEQAGRWGLTRYLPTLHDRAPLLAQIGGRL